MIKILAIVFGIFSFSLLIGEELRIFELHQAPKGNQDKIFIDLSDWELWGGKGKAVKIKPSKDAKATKYKDSWDYHQLSQEKSEEILDALNIKQSDSIYIYDLELNKLIVLKVKDYLPLFAHENPYMAGEFVEEEYYFGFQIDKKSILFNTENDSLRFVVNIGRNNPFNENGVKKVIWKRVISDNFPIKEFSLENNDKTHKLKKESYKFLNENYGYYIYRLGPEYGYFIEVRENTGKVIFDFLQKSSEGIYLSSQDGLLQWTGKLFKDKGPVFFNMNHENAFGCDYIYVMDISKEKIPFLCNNRH